MRREFLKRTATEVGADFIALAHTADDQAETVLLRTCARHRADRARRDAVAAGPLGAPSPGGLAGGRGSVSARAPVRARQDPTNRDLRHARNRIRHKVMPELRRINPQADDAIAATAENLGQVSRLLERHGKGAFRASLHSEKPEGIRSCPPYSARLSSRHSRAGHPAGLGSYRRSHPRPDQTPPAGSRKDGAEGCRQIPRQFAAEHRIARLDRGLLFLGTDSPNPPRIAPGPRSIQRGKESSMSEQ